MTKDPIARLLGNALIQEVVSLPDLLDVVRTLPAKADGEELLRCLRDHSFLSDETLAALEHSGPGLMATAPRPCGSHPSGSDSEEHLGARVLTEHALSSFRQYRNLRFVAEGAMGRIFKAHDPTLGRSVALKFLKRVEPEVMARFLLEAQHQGSVEHPAICRVYEVGEWQGQAYIAMQYIHGEPLDRCLERLTLFQLVELMEAVADAIHTAHRQGLIHRDLKPANIMVAFPDHGQPRPYVLDFGLARDTEGSGLTVEGLVLGTLHFMAPEQARGDLAALGRTTDVYALGATLYASLAGKPPFWDCENLDCVNRTLEEDPVPLNKAAEGIPEELNTIVMKCLEKEPGRRYESARALGEDLRRFREGEPIMAIRPTLAYRLKKYALRRRALVGVSAVALVAVFTLAGFGLAARASARSRAAFAQQYGQQAERLEATVRYIRLLPAHDVRNEIAAIRHTLARMEAQIHQDGRLAAGPGSYALGRGAMALGHWDEALHHFQISLDLGYRDPQVSYALGKVQGQLYQRALQDAARLPDPALREAATRQAGHRWRDPALANLSTGAPMSLEPPEYARALLAFHGGNLSDALALSKAAFEKVPWFYEAKHLEAQVLHAMALRSPGAGEAADTLDEAFRAYRAAQTTAPSDPALLLGEEKAWRDFLVICCQQGWDPGSALASCRLAADRVLAIDPSSADARGVLASAHAAMLSEGVNTGQDVTALMAEVRRLAAQAEGQEPGSPEALTALLTALVRQAWSRTTSPQDPRPLLEEARSVMARLLAADPGNAGAFREGARAWRLQFLHERALGLSPWPSFEAGLALIGQALARHPEDVPLQQQMALLWAARAQLELDLGLDPRSSCQSALEVTARTRKLFPEALSPGVAASTHTILATYRLGQGDDPGPNLVAADQLFRPSQHSLRPEDRSRLASLCLLKAQQAFLAGDSPAVFLQEARTLLQAALGRSPFPWECNRLLASCDLLESRHRLRQRQSALLPLRRAQEALDRASASGLPQEEHLLLARAEAAYLASCAGMAAPARLQGATRELQDLLARNPHCPEALTLLGAILAQPGRSEADRVMGQRLVARAAQIRPAVVRLHGAVP